MIFSCYDNFFLEKLENFKNFDFFTFFDKNIDSKINVFLQENWNIIIIMHICKYIFI